MYRIVVAEVKDDDIGVFDGIFDIRLRLIIRIVSDGTAVAEVVNIPSHMGIQEASVSINIAACDAVLVNPSLSISVLALTCLLIEIFIEE